MLARILAVDPSLSATGFVVAEVPRFGQLVVIDLGTVRPSPKSSLATRLRLLSQSMTLWAEMAQGRETPAPPCFVVIEDPMLLSPRAKAHVQSGYLMAAAFGALVAAAAAVVSPERVQLVPVNRYYPRSRGFAHIRKAAAVAAGRRLLPSHTPNASEHVCMAALLASWWASNPAARLAPPPPLCR